MAWKGRTNCLKIQPQNEGGLLRMVPLSCHVVTRCFSVNFYLFTLKNRTQKRHHRHISILTIPITSVAANIKGKAYLFRCLSLAPSKKSSMNVLAFHRWNQSIRNWLYHSLHSLGIKLISSNTYWNFTLKLILKLAMVNLSVHCEPSNID